MRAAGRGAACEPVFLADRLPVKIFLLAILSARLVAAAGNPGVVNIRAMHAGVPWLGTGVCLDTPCAHVLTNYHVAALLGADLRVEGVAARNAQLFTGPYEPGAQAVETALGVRKYNPAKDLALLTLASALPGEFRGARFALDAPAVGQSVVRSARFGDEYDEASGVVVNDDVTHRSADGRLTAMPLHFLLSCASRPGNSGGAVMDAAGRVVGIVAMRSTGGGQHAGTLAISTALVAEFLNEANPALALALFPAQKQRAVTGPSEPLPDGFRMVNEAVSARADLVGLLRARSRENGAAMENVAALEAIDTWERGRAKRSWLFQVATGAGGQTYQRLPGRQAATSSVAWPRNVGVTPGEQWSILERLLDDAQIAFGGTGKYEGAPVNVFRYASSTGGCAVRYAGRKIYAGCSGWVVADAQMNTVLITQRMDIPEGDAAVIRWTEKFAPVAAGERTFMLASELEMSGEYRNGRVYRASARWSGYQVFVAESTLRFDAEVGQN